MKYRIKDLQSYKNDVSKTFKILDNELLLINEHIKKQAPDNTNQTNESIQIRRNATSAPSSRVSIMTPDILNSLFQNMNRERLNAQNLSQPSGLDEQVDEPSTEQPKEDHNENKEVSEEEIESTINLANVHSQMMPLIASISYETIIPGRSGGSFDRFLVNENETSRAET